MALSTFCTTCHRTVYIQEGDTPVCPVCSSPLVQTIETDESGGESQMEGTK
jgi:RNA polymerase subunit RPABC4/transcription elongation factor Spt4